MMHFLLLRHFMQFLLGERLLCLCNSFIVCKILAVGCYDKVVMAVDYYYVLGV